MKEKNFFGYVDQHLEWTNSKIKRIDRQRYRVFLAVTTWMVWVLYLASKPEGVDFFTITVAWVLPATTMYWAIIYFIRTTFGQAE